MVDIEEDKGMEKEAGGRDDEEEDEQEKEDNADVNNKGTQELKEQLPTPSQ